MVDFLMDKFMMFMFMLHYSHMLKYYVGDLKHEEITSVSLYFVIFTK